uniref:non-ribosomal peptide synthetase n=1 Tax=unclassified Serratia (in: enterobacteria) TaxID=2647522 RepID=UPI000468E4A0
SDYVSFQRRSLAGEQHQQNLAWWQKKLKDLPRLSLPIAKNTLSPSHNGDAVRIDINRALTEQVRRFSQQNSCTVFVTLLSAWACTLYRYSGQTDFGIGTLSAGRENSDFDEVQGFFVNTLVLRPALAAGMSFAELVNVMSLEVLESLRRQDTEFSEIAAGFTGSRSLDLNPLVQASFDFNIYPAAHTEDDFGCEWLDFERGDAGVDGTAKFNLGLSLLEKSGGIVGTLEFAVDLFDRGSVENLVEQFLVLLDGATAQPATGLAHLPMLNPELRDGQPAEASFDISCPVYQLIEQAARNYPQRTAVSFGDESLSYEAFQRETDRVSRCLLAQGVTRGSVVGVYLDRSPLAIVAVVAIMQAGAVYLPLDVTYPAARLAYIVENAGCEYIVAGPQAGQAAAWFSGQLLATDGEGAVQPASGAVSGDPLAYMIYTSGSTGKPKGVEVPHSCLTNLILHYAESLAVSEQDRLLGVTPFSFDISILEIFLPLVCGAELRLLSREQSRNAEELLRETAQVTLMQATPATWHLLAEAGWAGNPRLKALCGGEALTLTLAKVLAARTGEAWNCYGPTETTIWSASWRIDPSRGSVTIGDAITNTRLYVLDDHMQPVAKGIPGELYIGGSGVAAGYVNAPALTAERFIPSPFVTSERLYRTGDRVRRGHDGMIEYVERIDFQLKINGYRVEVSEIESVLEQHAKVSRSVVVPVTQGSETRLACYYIAAGEAAGEWELYDFLKGCLPEYMLPSVYRAVAAFPLSGSRKVDRKALAALPLNDSTVVEVNDGGNESEAVMVAIWEDILESKTIDRRRSFFEQGGNSLKLLMLQKGMKKAFGKNITIAE